MLSTHFQPQTAMLGVLVCLVLLAVATPLAHIRKASASEHIIYVNANAPVAGAKDGASWDNAYTELQPALARATSGDEIWVAAGVYLPVTLVNPAAESGNVANRQIAFNMKNGVAIYGGFAGGENQRDQRDWEANLTVLSGDISEDDAVAQIIGPRGLGVTPTAADINGSNSYRVINAETGINETAVLDGFTITGGQANGAGEFGNGGGIYNAGNPTFAHITVLGSMANGDGGGMYNTNSNPVLTHVALNNNSANGNGGGLFNTSSNPVLTHVTLNNNTANGSGGGLYNQNSSPPLNHVTLDGNTATNGSGGGIYNQSSSPTLDYVIIRNNQAANGSGGGIYNDSAQSNPVLTHVFIGGNQVGFEGGGIYNNDSTRDLKLTHVLISGNTTGNGGIGAGIYNFASSPELTDVIISGNEINGIGRGAGLANVDSAPRLINTTLRGNTVKGNGGRGGGIYNQRTGSFELINVVISGNAVEGDNGEGGAIYNHEGSSPILINVTIHGNAIKGNNGNGGGIYNEDGSPQIRNTIAWGNLAANGNIAIVNNGGTPTIQHSLLEGCQANGNWNFDCGTDGGNNLDSQDPVFEVSIDPNDAPAIAGNLRLQQMSPARDRGSNILLSSGLDFDRVGNARVFNNIVDLGAYEWWPTPQCPNGGVLYVDQSATGPGDGLSWPTAYRDLQEALRVDSPCEIWVAKGIYRPTDDPTRRQVAFALQTGIALYGGFAGGEDERGQRDWEANVTVLSGDIDDERDDVDVHGMTLIHENGQPLIFGQNSFHVVTGNSVNDTAVLDGFTITGGQADGAGDAENGGGLFTANSSAPRLQNALIHGNMAIGLGGGVYNFDNGNPELTNVTISGNFAFGLGGGMLNEQNSSPKLTEVVIIHNTAGANGGGIYNFNNSNPTLANVALRENTADINGGAMFNDNSSPTLTDVVIANNSANSGGGIFNQDRSAPVLTNVSIRGNTADNFDGGGIYNVNSSPTLTNVTFSGNRGARNGGGIANFGNSSPTLTNVTITGNWAAGNAPDGRGGGVFNDEINNDRPMPTIQNSIIWDNRDNSGTNAPSASIYRSTNSNPTIRYSLVQGCNPGGAWAAECGANGGSNLSDADPLFALAPDPADAPTIVGNLRLQASSPAIDAGDNGSVPAGVATDLDGTARIVGDAVDLGAYETNRPPVAHGGGNQTVGAGAVVTLDGSGSNVDAGQGPLTYNWTQTSGPDVTLSDPTAVSPTFTAPDAPAELTFRLMVTDRFGVSSAPIDVTITITGSSAEEEEQEEEEEEEEQEEENPEEPDPATFRLVIPGLSRGN